MKKVIGYIASWTLFWIGDATCRIMESDDEDSWRWKLYTVYTKCMTWSYNIQIWAGDTVGPWGRKGR